MKRICSNNSKANTNYFSVNVDIFLLAFCLVLTSTLMLNTFRLDYSFLSNLGFFENVTSNYSTDWLSNITKSTFSVNPTREKPLCSFEGSDKFKDSTPDDLIIGILMGHPRGYQAFVRSLSSAQTESTLVILTNDTTLPRIPEVDVNFRLKIISIGELPKQYFGNSFLNIIVLFEFLVHYAHFFNRIIITDITDVVFQEDPFDSRADWSLLNFNFEYYTLKEQLTNVFWVNEVKGWLMNDAMETEQINAGLMAGNSKLIKDLALLILYLWYSPEINIIANDQGIIEFALLNHFFQDLGLDYQTRGRAHIGAFTVCHETLIDYFPNVVARHSDDLIACVHKYLLYEMRDSIIKWCNLYNISFATR